MRQYLFFGFTCLFILEMQIKSLLLCLVLVSAATPDQSQVRSGITEDITTLIGKTSIEINRAEYDTDASFLRMRLVLVDFDAFLKEPSRQNEMVRIRIMAKFMQTELKKHVETTKGHLADLFKDWARVLIRVRVYISQIVEKAVEFAIADPMLTEPDAYGDRIVKLFTATTLTFEDLDGSILMELDSKFGADYDDFFSSPSTDNGVLKTFAHRVILALAGFAQLVDSKSDMYSHLERWIDRWRMLAQAGPAEEVSMSLSKLQIVNYVEQLFDNTLKLVENVIENGGKEFGSVNNSLNRLKNQHDPVVTVHTVLSVLDKSLSTKLKGADRLRLLHLMKKWENIAKLFNDDMDDSPDSVPVDEAKEEKRPTKKELRARKRFEEKVSRPFIVSRSEIDEEVVEQVSEPALMIEVEGEKVEERQDNNHHDPDKGKPVLNEDENIVESELSPDKNVMTESNASSKTDIIEANVSQLVDDSVGGFVNEFIEETTIGEAVSEEKSEFYTITEEGQTSDNMSFQPKRFEQRRHFPKPPHLRGHVDPPALIAPRQDVIEYRYIRPFTDVLTRNLEVSARAVNSQLAEMSSLCDTIAMHSVDGLTLSGAQALRVRLECISQLMKDFETSSGTLVHFSDLVPPLPVGISRSLNN